MTNPDVPRTSRFGSKIDKFRVLNHLTIAELLTISGVARKTYRDVQKGRYSVSIETLSRLSAALACSVVDIYPGLAVPTKVARASPRRNPRSRTTKAGREKREAMLSDAARMALEL